jgi:dihydrofolate reductase
MIVYGGVGFVTSLIENNPIDELNLFINPTAAGKGLRIFSGKVPLQLDHLSNIIAVLSSTNMCRQTNIFIFDCESKR